MVSQQEQLRNSHFNTWMRHYLNLKPVTTEIYPTFKISNCSTNTASVPSIIMNRRIDVCLSFTKLILLIYADCIRSRDSAVGIATGYRLDDREIGVQVTVGSRNFSSPCRPDRLWANPTSYLVGTGGSFPCVKRTGRETDHSPSANAEVKKILIYTSSPPYAFMA
jgi:hypothetical protein